MLGLVKAGTIVVGRVDEGMPGSQMPLVLGLVEGRVDGQSEGGMLGSKRPLDVFEVAVCCGGLPVVEVGVVDGSVVVGGFNGGVVGGGVDGGGGDGGVEVGFVDGVLVFVGVDGGVTFGGGVGGGFFVDCVDVDGVSGVIVVVMRRC